MVIYSKPRQRSFSRKYMHMIYARPNAIDKRLCCRTLSKWLNVPDYALRFEYSILIGFIYGQAGLLSQYLILSVWVKKKKAI